jgi:hypothetical protein
MPRLADGTFQRFNDQYYGSDVWQQDLETNKKIIALRHDTHDEDLALGIAQCLPKDGSEPMTNNLQMGGFSITNLRNAAALENQNAATFGQTITSVNFVDSNRTLTLIREGMSNLSVVIPGGGDNTVINYGLQTLHVGTGLRFLSGETTAGQDNQEDTILLTNTGVAAGTFNNANVTVDLQGRITAISQGSIPALHMTSTPVGNNVEVSIDTYGGTPAVILPAIPTGTAGARSGVMTAQMLKDLNDAVSGSGTVSNLSITNRTTNTLRINNTGGTNADMPLATTSLAGLMSGSDKSDLDALVAGGGGDPDQSLSESADTIGVYITITKQTGNQTISLFPANGTNAGIMSVDQANRIAGLNNDPIDITRTTSLLNFTTWNDGESYDFPDWGVQSFPLPEHALGGLFYGQVLPIASMPDQATADANHDNTVWFLY